MDDRACTRAGGGGGGVGAGGESISVRFQLRCYLPLLSVKLLCDANEPAGRGGAAGRRGRAPASCTHSNIAQIFLAAAVPTQPASFSECIRVRFSTADINPIKIKLTIFYWSSNKKASLILLTGFRWGFITNCRCYSFHQYFDILLSYKVRSVTGAYALAIVGSVVRLHIYCEPLTLPDMN